MAAPTNIWYTDIASPAQVDGQNTLANLTDTNLACGRLKLVTAVYTMTGNEVANDAIYIARVNQGALVNPANGNIATGVGQAAATLTIQVGDTDTWGGARAYDPARYSAAVDVHSQTTTTPVSFSNGTTLTVPAEVQDDWVWLVATFATLNTPSAGKTLIFRIPVVTLD